MTDYAEIMSVLISQGKSEKAARRHVCRNKDFPIEARNHAALISRWNARACSGLPKIKTGRVEKWPARPETPWAVIVNGKSVGFYRSRKAARDDLRILKERG